MTKCISIITLVSIIAVLVSGCTQSSDDKPDIMALRDAFNQSLPRALDLIREKEYMAAGEILEQARTILDAPPLSSLSLRAQFDNELQQIQKCIIALVLLSEVETLNTAFDPETSIVEPERTEADMLTIVELCSAILSAASDDCSKLMDELIAVHSQSTTPDRRTLLGYALLSNSDWVNKCFEEYTPLTFFSFRTFMIFKVAIRSNTSPPPPAPERIHYDSEVKAIYGVAMEAKSSHCLLIYTLANHMGVILGNRIVNYWQHGWQHQALQRRYVKNMHFAFLDPWGQWTNARDLRQLMKSRFDYALFRKYR